MTECNHEPHAAKSHFHGHECAHCGALVFRGLSEVMLQRKIMADLLRGIPADQVVWKGEEVVTAGQMIEHIEKGTDTGCEYASDILKASREMLRGRSRK